MKIYPYLVLVRPANVITAISDVIAGAALSGVFVNSNSNSLITNVILLCIATSGLYAGGIVFNDVFDMETDQLERPERPLPLGNVSKNSAIIFGSILLLMGIITSALVSTLSLSISIVIAIAALAYDGYFKHFQIGGPLVMGLCRGLNLLLGMSILIDHLPSLSYISFIPVIFIAAITLTSQGEVLGNNRLSIIFALLLDFAVSIAILILAWNGLLEFWTVLPFVLLWIGMNAWAKSNAIVKNDSKHIMAAVKIGVISLIPLNASYAAGSSSWIIGVGVLTLLPVSLLLARKFAVT